PRTLDFVLGESTAAYNIGNLMRKHGNPHFARDYYARALKAFDTTEPDQRKDVAVQNHVRVVHWKSAEVLTQLDRPGEALEHWDRAIALAGPLDQPWLELGRACSQAKAGDHVKAATAADALLKPVGKYGEPLFLLSHVYAQAAAAAQR